METAMSAEKKLQALIVPLRSMNLVVPQVLVAEIIPFPHVTSLGELPWFQGMFEWREHTIPLLSIERFCNPDEEGRSAMRSRRVAVLNGLGEVDGVGQYGIEIGSIPHPVRLGENEVKPLDSAKPCEMLAQHVHAAGVRAAVPDFAALEHRVGQALKALQRSAGEIQDAPN
jgi:chemotaxis signal transduction protein